MLLPEFLRRMAEQYPGERAYRVVDGGSLTFSEWDRQANRLARGLVAVGLEPGDRAAIHLDAVNALRWLVSYSAIHRAGGVAVPMNPRLSPHEIARVMAHADVRVAVADEALVAEDLRALASLVDPQGSLRVRTVVDASMQRAAVDLPGVLPWAGASPATTRRCRWSGTARTWPTSSTRRVPQEIPRGSASVSPTPRWCRARIRVGTAANGSWPARCSPSPGSPSSTTR